MIFIAVLQVIFFLIFLSVLNRVGFLPIKAVVVDEHTVCIILRNPFGALEVASVLGPMKEVLSVILHRLFDAVVIVVSMALLRMLKSPELTSSDCLAMVLFSGSSRQLQLAAPLASRCLALVPYVKASLARSSGRPTSPCRALVLYAGARTASICRPMKPRLAISYDKDEISLPSLVLDSSISTTPSSPSPSTPALPGTPLVSGPILADKEQCNTTSSSSGLLPSPTIRQLKASPCSVPLIGDRERPSAMIMNVKGRSVFSSFPIKDLVIERQLGEGGFGTVLLTRQRGSGKRFAVKKIEKEQRPRRAELQRGYVRTEAEAMCMMSDHPELFVELLGMYQTRTHYYLIMPFCEGGDLGGWLAREKRFSVRRTVLIVAQIVHMIELMNKRGILHRDLKPGNILISRDGYVRACDFGLCHIYICGIALRNDLYSNKYFNLNEALGTPAYGPPEMILGDTYNRWVDLYSLGLMTYEMLTGELPDRIVYDTPSGDVLDHPELNAISPQHMQYLDSDSLDFIKTLLFNPSEPFRRVSIADVKAHPFLRTAPWHEIENDLTFTMV